MYGSNEFDSAQQHPQTNYQQEYSPQQTPQQAEFSPPQEYSHEFTIPSVEGGYSGVMDLCHLQPNQSQQISNETPLQNPQPVEENPWNNL